VVAGGPPPVPRDAGGPPGVDPLPGDHARGRGVRRPVRQAGRVPERTQGLRSRGPAVPSLPHPDPGREDLRAERVLLPAVPELRAADGCRWERREPGPPLRARSDRDGCGAARRAVLVPPATPPRGRASLARPRALPLEG